MVEKSILLDVQESRLLVLRERLALLDSAIYALELYQSQLVENGRDSRNPAPPPAFNTLCRRD